MKDAPALTLEHFKATERWSAADRLHHLVTSGEDQVTFAATETGFVLSYLAKRAASPEPGVAA